MARQLTAAVARRPGRDPARLAYDCAADAWSTGAMVAYAPLAEHLVDRCPIELAGSLALDAGAGTGAAAAALAARGASVVATDLQADMLQRAAAVGATALVAADVTALPLRTGAFDVAVGAFVLNHLADPVAGLRELSRACRPGGAVLASTFGARRASAKDVVDDVVARVGWRAPGWYEAIRARQRAIETPQLLSGVARRAGLRCVDASSGPIDVGLDDPADVARYRLGMPQYTPFLRTLDDAARDALTREIVERLDAVGETFRPVVVELRARVS